MKFARLIVGTMCSLPVAGLAIAQETSSANPTTTTSKIESQNGASSKQEMIATCLSLENQSEVSLAKLAVEKSKEKEVVAFAKKMIDMHGKCVQDLARIEPTVAKLQALSETTASGTANAANNANAVSNQASTNPKNDMVQIQCELAQQCLADSKEMLNKDGGKHFDEAYIGLQIAKHYAMHSQLTVFQRHTTGEMKELVTKGLAMTKEHLTEAERIMKSLSK